MACARGIMRGRIGDDRRCLGKNFFQQQELHGAREGPELLQCESIYLLRLIEERLDDLGVPIGLGRREVRVGCRHNARLIIHAGPDGARQARNAACAATEFL